MQRNSSDDIDVEAASEQLANLSVFEPERSPLKGIPLNSPRVKARTSPKATCPDKPAVKSSGSESEQEKDYREAQVHFNKLVKKAKHLAQEGKVQEALELNRQALKIHHHEKLARRIAKMEEYLKNYGDEDEEDESEGGMIQLGSNTGFYLHKDLNAKLYSHQKEGVLWLWRLYKKEKGGILGDDMGLGKTIQIIAFLSGLFDMDKVQTVMIVLPVSVMINWEKEFNKWAPGIAVYSFHGTSKRERERSLDRVQRRGGVMLTTYGMVLTSWEQMSNRDGKEFAWDYVILDEGHKIKNPSKTTKAIHSVVAKHRIILTGTPIQNNLKELWTLFDYVQQGALLGTLRTFKMEFENPIIRARERDATSGEKRLGMEMAESLKKIIDPYFLRRTKAGVKEEEKRANTDGKPHLKSIKMPTMTFKNDFVVWLYLSETQLKIYRDFLELDSVKELLMSSKSPLVALNVLKKICDHPRLLSLRACHQLGLHGQGVNEDELELPSSLESAVTKIEALDDAILVGEAGKMTVLISLVDQLRQEGHRSLIFSQSRKMLDIMQKVLRNRGHKVMRLDGTIKSVTERDELVQKFQMNPSYSVFLLTTQVGGVGLTLTAADRVIIYDPSWNPATDAQAVDRAFRIGQTRNVVIYRLITCGTVEEKIYRRQVFKDSITRQTTGNAKDPYRYFTKQELRELFQLEEPRFSNTQRQLEEMHGLDRRRDPELDDHIAFLHSLNIFGISDHDLMFSQESPAHETKEEEVPATHMPPMAAQHQDYIKHRVQKAKEIIERESSIPGTMEQRMKTGFPIMSVYSAPENQALMSGVPVFQPNPSHNGRPMLNRPGWGVPAFQPKPTDINRQMLNRPPAVPAKAPQVIVVYPPKPIRSEVRSDDKSDVSNTSQGSSSSDPIDLTADEGGVKVTATESLSASGQLSSSSGEDAAGNSVVLPKIEKRKKGESRPGHKSPGQQSDATVYTQVEQKAPAVSGEAPPASSETSLPPEPKPQSPTAIPQSPKASVGKGHALPAQCATPAGKPQAIVEEELIISPNAYTPLLMARQKRRRLTNSPIRTLEKAFATSLLVAESPDVSPVKPAGSSGDAPLSATERKSSKGSDTPDELASFLAEEDLDRIQESFIEEDAETPASADEDLGSADDNPGSDVPESSDNSDDSEPINNLKSIRRRSVCRRVAVIESSEDEEEDEENKENLHPTFSNTSFQNIETADENQINDENEEEPDSRDETDEVDGSDETDGGDEMGDEEADDEEEAEEETDDAVVVYDESMTEGKEGEDEETEREEEEGGSEQEEEEEGSSEQEEEEAQEEEVDMELVQQLLKEGKYFYKQKQYKEALDKCQAAMAMVQDPSLQAMIDKIQNKIDAGL